MANNTPHTQLTGRRQDKASYWVNTLCKPDAALHRMTSVTMLMYKAKESALGESGCKGKPPDALIDLPFLRRGEDTALYLWSTYVE